MPIELSEVHLDCAGSQHLVGHGGCLSRLPSRIVVPCTFSDMAVTFPGSARESSCFGGLYKVYKVDFS